MITNVVAERGLDGGTKKNHRRNPHSRDPASALTALTRISRVIVSILLP